MIGRISYFIIFIFFLFVGCEKQPTKETFESAVESLKNIPDLHILKSENAMVAVSGKLQGRVFTSSTDGFIGNSLGWFNKNIIEDGSFKKNYSRIGGEDRMWFGPQYGKFTVNCEPGIPLKEENMRNSPDLDRVDFKILNKSDTALTCQGSMKIQNYQGFTFEMDVTRAISILNKTTIQSKLNTSINQEVKSVAFTTNTTITNTGNKQWLKNNGLISIWILGCIKPSDKSVAIIPVKNDPKEITNYFTPIDERRLKIKNNFVFYKSDANYLNKIGILPENTIPRFGTYSPELDLLTIVEFSFEEAPLYVNSHKTDQKFPFKGDVINIFNDGVLGDVGPFGPFYELESSSAAKELFPKEKLSHTHSTYHFEGDKKYLDRISKDVLGIHLDQIPKF